MPPKRPKKDPKMSSEPSNVKEKEKDPVDPIFGTSIPPEDYGKHKYILLLKLLTQCYHDVNMMLLFHWKICMLSPKILYFTML